jgi:large subunit ribosomal protein L15e
MYRHLKALWRKPTGSLDDIRKDRLIRWRDEPVVTRAERPARIDRARSLGYKAKQGFVVARVRVTRGGRKIPDFAGGRRPRRAGRFFTLNKPIQQVAEEKASLKFRNMEVLNSYWADEDGKHVWYEVILADASHPSVRKDKNLKWLASGKHTGRASRGLTSAGKRSRGMRHKGKKG